VVRSQRNNWKTRKWTTPKQVRIHPKYTTTVAFSWQEDKDGTKQTNTVLSQVKFIFIATFKKRKSKQRKLFSDLASCTYSITLTQYQLKVQFSSIFPNIYTLNQQSCKQYPWLYLSRMQRKSSIVSKECMVWVLVFRTCKQTLRWPSLKPIFLLHTSQQLKMQYGMVPFRQTNHVFPISTTHAYPISLCI